MTTFTFRQLIDLAIGSPEPGHVNFYALHCLLFSLAEKLNIVEEPVDCSKYSNVSLVLANIPCSPYHKESKSNDFYKTIVEITKGSSKTRIAGGAEPEDDQEAPKENAGESAEAPPAPVESAPTEEEGAAQPTPDEGAVEEAPPEEQPQDTENQDEKPAETEQPFDPFPVPPPAETTQADASKAEEEKKDKYGIIGVPSERILARSASLVQEQAAIMAEMITMKQGVSIMKDQVEVAMQQLDVLTNSLLDPNVGPAKFEKYLRSLSDKLKSIQKSNTFIEGTHRFHLEQTASLTQMSSERLSEAEEEQSRSSERSGTYVEPDQFELEQHLVYTPEKLLDLVLDLKASFCVLSNKVNDLAATVLEQDCQRTMRILNEMQDQLTEFKHTTAQLKEMQEHLESKQANNDSVILQLKDSLHEMNELKIDKSEVLLLLAEKADYKQLQRKVSQEQFLEVQCRLEKQFCEVYKLMNTNEKKIKSTIENLRSILGLEDMDEILRKFKEKIEQQIQILAETLQKYIEATNDDCAAAGARVKVLHDLACISCDTNCVMRTVEKARVGKLANAHQTSTLAPLVTYELGNIRKSGIMGYHRKDEFPHSTNAWMNKPLAGMKACVPRHAGGPHTVTSAKDRLEKIHLSKK